MSLSPELLWFLAGLALILLEFAVPGIILVFFGAGAWVAAATTWFGWTDSLTSQLVVFVVSSLILLFSLRHWVRSRFLGFQSDEQNPEVNLDEFAGQQVKVLEDITPGRKDGRVEFKGAGWAAVSDTPLAAGEQARIVSADGIVLRVRKLEEEE
jgi:membrane protein implicated in regulation of membrane protease activity